MPAPVRMTIRSNSAHARLPAISRIEQAMNRKGMAPEQQQRAEVRRCCRHAEDREIKDETSGQTQRGANQPVVESVAPQK